MSREIYEGEASEFGLNHRQTERYLVARALTQGFSTIAIRHRDVVEKFVASHFKDACSHFAFNEDAELSLWTPSSLPWMVGEYESRADCNGASILLSELTQRSAIIIETPKGFACLHRFGAASTTKNFDRASRILARRFPSAIFGAHARDAYLSVWDVVSVPRVFSDAFELALDLRDLRIGVVA